MQKNNFRFLILFASFINTQIFAQAQTASTDDYAKTAIFKYSELIPLAVPQMIT